MQQIDPVVGVHVCNYYLPTTNHLELLAQQKRILMDEAISTNTKLIQRIQKVISDGFEYVKNYELTDGGKTIFNHLIRVIQNMNQTIPLVRSDSLDSYLLEMKEYTAVEIFKHGLKPNTVATRVYRTRYADYDLVHIWCSENGKGFIDYLMTLSTPINMLRSPYRSPPAKRSRIDTTGGGEEEDKSITTLFLEAVGGNKDEAEDILLVLYDYLDYVGITPLNPKIVNYLVKNLDEIQQMSLTEFKDNFYEICDKLINEGIIKKQDDIIETAFSFLPTFVAAPVVAATAGGGKTRRKLRGKK